MSNIMQNMLSELPADAAENARSFLKIISHLSPSQIRNQHAYLCVELDVAGFQTNDPLVIEINTKIIARLYPELSPRCTTCGHKLTHCTCGPAPTPSQTNRSANI